MKNNTSSAFDLSIFAVKSTPSIDSNVINQQNSAAFLLKLPLQNVFLFIILLFISIKTYALTPYSSCNYSNEYYKRCFYGGAELGASLLTPNDSQSSWKSQNSLSGMGGLQLGWRLHKRIFTEVDVSYLGANKFENIDTSISETVTLHYFTPAFYLGGYLFKAEQSKSYNLFMKNGFSAVRNRTSSDTITFTNNSNFQYSFVVGAELQLQADIFARINYNSFTKDARAISLSIHRFF